MLKSTITTLFVLNAAILTFALSATTSLAQADRKPGQGAIDNPDALVAVDDEDQTSIGRRADLPNPPDQLPGSASRKPAQGRVDDEDANDEFETGADKDRERRRQAAPSPRPQAPAHARSFGKGTPGSNGRVLMDVSSAPRVGNKSFAIEGKNAPARSAGALLVAPAADAIYRGSHPLGGNLTVYIDTASYSADLVKGLTSNTFGQWTLPAPLPNNPALGNLKIVMQSFWYDGATGTLASSNGVEFRIQP